MSKSNENKNVLTTGGLPSGTYSVQVSNEEILDVDPKVIEEMKKKLAPTILRDAYRNKKLIALVKVGEKFEIQVEGVKRGHAFRNYQNAVSSFMTLVYGDIGKDI